MSVQDYLPQIQSAIGTWGSAYGVGDVLTPVLVSAVMLQENPQLNPAQVTDEPNGHQSYGLLQVEDSTAAQLGYPDPSALLDPATGIDAGVHYLARQLARYPGDVDAAIAAYNAGSARYTNAGTFVNQSYIDRVRAYMAQLGGEAVRAVSSPAGVALGVGAVAAVAAVALRRRRRRGGRRGPGWVMVSAAALAAAVAWTLARRAEQ